jgi:hypothetical protein
MRDPLHRVAAIAVWAMLILAARFVFWPPTNYPFIGAWVFVALGIFLLILCTILMCDGD